eukprot:Gregarina_sp_Pseudo_9__282@NODE_1180_length_1808_cov_191_534765_g1106_i0_p4_GENE_NODE_1180_length_1808_cov_191_534765_g1106_i0NODE_1180_length_1808_cov_191_534765_g1106_i0_p4_ORF_typecomplete_len146_score33_10Ribosomal_L27e/PF01777_18/1_9e23KOW/PF00467_29/2_1e05DapH_N/PF08503_10/1_8e03DapH_N/PF08503_10/0_35_NODE_1180_length_1808_cov_191_534765_g1106_i0159596
MAQVRVFKQGRVVVILSGRFAGKKAVVLSAYDQGNRQRSFGHALVVGIEKAPMKVTKKMNQAKIEKRTRVKVFLKHVNYTHMMPTRYVVNDIDAKTLIGDRKIETPSEKHDVKRDIGKQLKQKFIAPEDAKTSRDLVFFRKPLRF